jgi:dipeptidase E
MRQQIIAMGGGGFSIDSTNLALDRYALEQTHTQRPKVCFVPTASGDSETYTQKFYEAYRTLECVPTHLSLFKPPTTDFDSFVKEQDMIYVGGGNTRNLLVLWRDWGLDTIFRSALEQGIVMAGLSAGSLCWFEQGVTDSMKTPDSTRLASIPCLGFLKGSNCPHYDGEEYRRGEYHRLLLEGQVVDGWAADDGVALHYVDGELESIVSSRPNAFAYRVENKEGTIVEERVTPTYLH